MKPFAIVAILLAASTAQAGNGYCGSCYQYKGGHYQPQKTYVHPQVKEVIKEVRPEYHNQHNTSHSLTITNYYQFSQPAAEQGVSQYGLGDPVDEQTDLGALVTLFTRGVDKNFDGLLGVQSSIGNLLDKGLAGQQRIAELREKRRLIEATIKALNGDGGAKSITLQGQFGDTNAAPNQGTVQGDVGALNMSALRASIEQVVLTRCAECHSDKDPKAGINMLRVLSFDLPTMDRVLASIESGRMPKDAEPLPLKEKAVFATLYQIIQQRGN